MNQFATWRYVIIIITVMMSLVYALPNLFGESPAIQIMSIKSGEKIESSVLANVENSLIAENIKNNGIIIEPLYIKVKFASADDQPHIFLLKLPEFWLLLPVDHQQRQT